MGDMQFNGTPEEWDALVKKNRETTIAQDISKMETTQTAVQWLALRYHHRQGYLSQEDIEQAKAMEKEHIEKAKSDGYDVAMSDAIKEIHKNYKPI